MYQIGSLFHTHTHTHTYIYIYIYDGDGDADGSVRDSQTSQPLGRCDDDDDDRKT